MSISGRLSAYMNTYSAPHNIMGTQVSLLPESPVVVLWLLDGGNLLLEKKAVVKKYIITKTFNPLVL